MVAFCEQADVLLMPYTRPEYSSGILALAAKTCTPVIGPDAGLLGRLIRQNGLGAVCAVRPPELVEALAAAVRRRPLVDEEFRKTFVQQSRPEEFARILFENIDHES